MLQNQHVFLYITTIVEKRTPSLCLAIFHHQMHSEFYNHRYDSMPANTPDFRNSETVNSPDNLLISYWCRSNGCFQVVSKCGMCVVVSGEPTQGQSRAEWTLTILPHVCLTQALLSAHCAADNRWNPARSSMLPNFTFLGVRPLLLTLAIFCQRALHLVF